MIRRYATCPECLRTFDLFNADDAEGWAYGHDCEPDGCQDCGGAGSVPAANPEQEQDNGYAPCSTCDGQGIIPPGRTVRHA